MQKSTPSSSDAAGARPRRSLWRWLLALGVVLVGALGGLYWWSRPVPPERSSPIQARLELAAGPVDLDRGQGATRAETGAALLADTVVSTQAGARALVRLPDGSGVFLREKTQIKLGVAQVELLAGEYWLDAPPTDRTPLVHRVGQVEIAAADSGLDLRREGEGAVVYVARGLATLTAPKGRVEVKSGEQVVATAEAAPSVAPLAFWDDWTGGRADLGGQGLPGAGSGTIYGVDEGALPGAPVTKLEVSRQVVRAKLRDGIAQTEVDQTFFNPAERPVEGWYWFTVPERASVTSFAVETNGVLVEGEFIEKKEAAAKYGVAKASGFAPAILEYVDAKSYRARIYPVPAGGTRRVVLRYVELNPPRDEKLSYVYPMGGREPARIGEFSLSVDLGADATRWSVTTLADARLEQGGRLVTMRRSGYVPRADFQLVASGMKSRAPVTVARFQAGGEAADYVLARYTPDLDWSKAAQPRGDVVLVVDTSAAGDEASRQLATQTAEAILRALSAEDRFALVALDVRPTIVHPAEGLAPASEAEIAKALEALAGHAAGGATDLASLFDVSLQRLHGAEQPAVVYVGDGLPTSGVITSQQLVERLRRSFSGARARLFTVGVGVDADYALLGELARAGGGQSLRVEESEASMARALELAAAVKTPTITDLELDLGAGLDDVFDSASGKVSRGQDVLVLARTHHDLPGQLRVKGRLGGEPFERSYEVERDRGVLSQYVPRLWAAEYVRRLLGSSSAPDAERGRIVALGVEYGLMTPYTSVLALESEAAYSRMGIQRRRSPLRGVELTRLDPTQERSLLESLTPASQVAFGCSRAEPAREETMAAAPAAVAKAEEGERQDDKLEKAQEAPEAPAKDGDPLAGPALEPAPAAASPAGRGEGSGGLGLMGFGSGGGGKVSGGNLDELPARRQGGVAGPVARPTAAPPPPPPPRSARAILARLAAQRAATTDAALSFQLATCSDASQRPLAQRMLLWQKRLRTASSPQELIERYQTAGRACELPDWRAERSFLELLQRRVTDVGAVSVVLGHFAPRVDVQRFIARLILRRTVDEALIAAVNRALFGDSINWTLADVELTGIQDPDKRLARLRELAAQSPDDPNGAVRLVRLYSQLGKKEEAVMLGRKLRDSGLLTPLIARQVGDVLARSGASEEAVRTYSEIVEFDPESLPSRQLLGDIYLGHGWYGPAYTQYLTLTEQAPADAISLLRLAAAAAGSGRVDEALRLERRVASAQGTPGPTDPRRWARWMSAARLARLLEEPPKTPAGQPPVDAAKHAEAVQRKLKELQLWNSPGTLALLTWEALDAELQLVTRSADKKEVSLGESSSASAIGLVAALLSPSDVEGTSYGVRLTTPRRDDPVPVTLHLLTWDGQRFSVRLVRGVLAAGDTELSL